MNLERTKQEIIDECHEDYVGLWSLSWNLKRSFQEASEQDIRSLTIKLVRELLQEKDIHAGQFGAGAKFIIWEMDVDEVVSRIEKEWDELGREPTIGDIVWFVAE
jgi:hypothetical protein